MGDRNPLNIVISGPGRGLFVPRGISSVGIRISRVSISVIKIIIVVMATIEIVVVVKEISVRISAVVIGCVRLEIGIRTGSGKLTGIFLDKIIKILFCEPVGSDKIHIILKKISSCR